MVGGGEPLEAIAMLSGRLVAGSGPREDLTLSLLVADVRSRNCSAKLRSYCCGSRAIPAKTQDAPVVNHFARSRTHGHEYLSSELS